MTKKQIITIPIHIGDYLKDTRFLSTEEHGAYWLLLIELYSSGGELPLNNERLRRVCGGLSKAKWRKIGPVILDLCTVSGGMITHKRVVQTIEKISNISEKRSKARKSRFSQKQKKSNKNNVDNEQLIDTCSTNQNQSQNLKPREDKSSLSADERESKFQEFWEQYPNTENQLQIASRSEWVNLDEGQMSRCLSCLPAYKSACRKEGREPLYPLNFLRDRYFERLAVAGDDHSQISNIIQSIRQERETA